MKERREAAASDVKVRAEILEVPSAGFSVPELATELAITAADVVKTLFIKGVMVQVNQVLEPEYVKMVCDEFEVEVLDGEEGEVSDQARKTTDFGEADDEGDMETRAPVVAIMGHVDHGKTSLLDYIRSASVADGEAGGITQGIGAYKVAVPSAEGSMTDLVFLDTPGHEAFSAMRARGARVTDVAVVIVAADDGVRPQTIEAISHAQAAEVPLVIAINKTDKPGSQPDRVKQELAEQGLLPEEWGGSTQMVPLSAKTGNGISDLLETLQLVAEMENLQANPTRMAAGTVIEARLDKLRGPTATLLVQAGTIRTGDMVVTGAAYGKVRALSDDRGNALEEAGPATPVQMLGLSETPIAGDEFQVVETEQEARTLAEEAAELLRRERLNMQAGQVGVSLTNIPENGEEQQRLNVIVKTDLSGSVEAIKAALSVIPSEKVALRFLLATTGEVNESDIDLAYASKAVVLLFNVPMSEQVREAASSKGVEVREYRVIYDLVEDVKLAMEGMLSTLQEKVDIGSAQVKAVFGRGKKAVAGCIVTVGSLKKGCICIVKRGKDIVHTSNVDSLRRVKDNVSEVTEGTECGVGVNEFHDWEEGDVIEAFEIVNVKQTIDIPDADDEK